MEFNLLRLRNNVDRSIPVDVSYSFSEEELKQTEILKLDNLRVVGEITKDGLDQIFVNLRAYGDMYLPCAITLKPVKYPFDIEISGEIGELIAENEENIKKDENTLDILPIIWENILMEIPMRVVSEGASLSDLKGDFRVVTDNEENVNPELEKLKDLL